MSDRKNMTNHFDMVKHLICSFRFWFIVIILFTIIYRFWDLGHTPAGYQIDEMGSAYDAWSLLHYGVDRYQDSWPVYFINFGGGQNALYDYMLVISMAIFGFSQFAIRLPAVINSFLFALCGFGIIGLVWHENHGIRKEIPQLLFLLLYAIAPYSQMSARLGLESLAMLGWSTAFLYTLLLAIDHTMRGKVHHRLLWILSGICGGLTLYTYAISYLVLPLFLVLALIYAIYSKNIAVQQKIAVIRENSAVIEFSAEQGKGQQFKITFCDILSCAIPLIILAIPLILEQIVNITDGESFKLFGIFTVTKLYYYRSSEFTFSNFWNNLVTVFKSALMYDWIDYNSTDRFWTFYPISVPFFCIGLAAAVVRLAHSIRERRFDSYVLLLLWFLAEVFICSLLGEEGETGANPNTNKINGIFFVVMLMIVEGWIKCFGGMEHVQWRQILAGTAAIIYLVGFVEFSYFYFEEFHPSFIWRDTFTDALEYIESDAVLSQKTTFIDGMTDSYYIYYLASALPSPYEIDMIDREFGNIITPQDLNEIEEAATVTYGFGANYLVLCESEGYDALETTMLQIGYQKEAFGEYTLFYYK